MARNKEKHAGRLNRLWLQELDEEKEKKNPQRPGLGSLNSASEIKKWIPSIKKDIDFYLKQSQVSCYPERHINEFSSKIENLTKEYKAYIRKLRQFQPREESTPWTDRAYSRKHKLSTSIPEGSSKTVTANDEDNADIAKKSCVGFSPLSTPLLGKDDNYIQLYGYQVDFTPSIINEHPDGLENLPLDFDLKKHTVTENVIEIETNSSEMNEKLNGKVVSDVSSSACLLNSEHDRNVLNLPYSDSSDEDG